jgi:hypothetical protein
LRHVSFIAALVAVGLSLFLADGSAAHSDSYASKLRTAYLPIVTTLNRVTPACATVTTVGQLPACGRRVAPFRVAVAHFLQFLTSTPPPATAKADVRALITATKVLQRTFTTLATIINRKDLARSKAMGGPGHPIDNAIQAFVSAIGVVMLDLPGLRLPLPG